MKEKKGKFLLGVEVYVVRAWLLKFILLWGDFYFIYIFCI
jgi:hypothetical protein